MIRFVYIIIFLIYHGDMWINLKLIQWIKSKQKHSLSIVTFAFK